MAQQEERKRRDVSKEYRDDHIVVSWEPSYCIHTANCLNAEPEVFDSMRRPWIKLDAATADRVAAAIMKCPTGALQFRRVDGAKQEQPADCTIVQPRTNGPLFVAGDLKFIDREGNVTRETARAALCRCGGSENKPFCDGTHRSNGFKA